MKCHEYVVEFRVDVKDGDGAENGLPSSRKRQVSHGVCGQQSQRVEKSSSSGFIIVDSMKP